MVDGSELRLRLALTCAIVVACGCSEGDRDAAADASMRSAVDAARPVPDAGPSGPIIAEPLDEATYLFDPEALRTYELVLSPENLARLDANPSAEEYVEGTLRFEDQEIAGVGIRYKGSVGAFWGCLTGTTTTGAKVCTKLSMKVSFNWRDPEGRFYGLKKLQFHAMNRDSSMLKDRLGYALFRESGLAAPRAVHARLLINGELNGLFALVEQIDGRFTRSRFSEGGEGNLYQEAWPLRADNTRVAEATLRTQLETNEDEQPDFGGMLAFGRALEEADFAALPSVLAKFTDTDYGMRYVALDRLIAHDDGPMHWYCVREPCFNHNYFFYQEQTADRLWIIPWDLDSSFNLMTSPITTIWFDWDDTSRGCAAMKQEPAFPYPLRPPACDKLILGWAQAQKRYLEEVQALLDGPFEKERVEAALGAWEAQIAPAVEEAAALHDDAPTLSEWHTATVFLRSAIANLRKRAEERVMRGAVPVRDPWLPPSVDAGVPDAGPDPDLDGGL